MSFLQALIENADKFENEFDLAAFCYDYLIRTVGNETNYIAKYLETNEEAKIQNPNLELLKRFSDEIEKIFRYQEDKGFDFEKCIKYIKTEILKLNLEWKDYLDKKRNDSTKAYFILTAIDRYVLISKGKISTPSPLNKLYQCGSYIYFAPENNIIDHAVDTLEFPDRVRGKRIRYLLNNLVVMEDADLFKGTEPPRIVHLRIGENDRIRQDIVRNKTIKIAIIPFSEKEMSKIVHDEGTLFHIEYVEEHLSLSGLERALALLEYAIDQKANIILFPEFICYPRMQQIIGERLAQMYENDRERLASLLFVVAGSGWTEDNNNVAVLYSYSGELLGKQYKYSAYHDDELTENLENPGKETTIISIDGIGRCIVGICRDISNEEFTKSLANIFAPMFLLVPAWSPSINIGFTSQLKHITENNRRTCSVVCNCCEAIRSKRFKKVNGVVVTPLKKESSIEGKCENIERTENCNVNCEKNLCCFEIIMDFSIRSVKTGKIVRIRSPKICCVSGTKGI